jgi:glucose/mannose-6-phosphate isomerase
LAVNDDPDLSGIRKDQRYSAMLSQIERQHLMYKSGLVSGSRAELPEGSFRSMVVYGLGGSAMAGRMLESLAEILSDFPVHVSDGSRLPKWVGRDDLLVIVSYSGETAECILALEESTSRSLKAVVVASGGKLLSRSAELGVPSVTVERGLTPRMAVPEMFGVLAALYHRVSGNAAISPQSISEAADRLPTYFSTISPESKIEDNTALKCAGLASRSFLVSIGWAHTAVAGLRLRNQLAENAKRVSLSLRVPEDLHNAVEGLHTIPGQSAVLLRSRLETKDVSAQMEALKGMVGLGLEVSFSGGAVFELLSAVIWADMVSLYASYLLNVDPVELKAIPKIRESVTSTIRGAR